MSLPIDAQRLLGYLQARWATRPEGQDWIDVTYDQYVAAGVQRKCVSLAVSLLEAVGAVERAPPVKGPRGHPRGAVRLLRSGDSTAPVPGDQSHPPRRNNE